MDRQRTYRIGPRGDPSAGRSRQTDREARRAHRHRQGCAGRSEDLPRAPAAVPGRSRLLGKPHRHGARFRVFLFDNDTRILFTIVFDGDFKPYVEDLIKEVTPWLDQIFGDVWEGYKGMKDAGILELVHNAKVDAEFFYAAFPDSTRRDVEKAVRISSAVNELLDAAS